MPKRKQKETEAKPVVTTPLYAGFVIRFAAMVVDLAVVGVIQLILVVTVVGAFLAGIAFFVYSVLALVNLNNATLGKKLFGLKVVRKEPKITYGVAALREVVGKLISSAVLGLGYLWVIWDKEKQGWHDKIAGTHVVHVDGFGTGRKIAAWIVTILIVLLVVVGPIVAALAIVPWMIRTQTSPADLNNSIRQLQQIQKDNEQLQNSLEELKDLQKQLEASAAGLSEPDLK